MTDFETETGTGTGAETQQRGRLGSAAGRVRDGLDTARARAGDTYVAARERTSSAAHAVRSRAGSAYGTARESASKVRSGTAEGIESSPMAALAGGLALGALLAAVLPKSQREEELLGQYGRRVTDAAREAARAAREAGTSKLDELGLNKEAARQKLGELAEGAREAARSSATAAAGTVRGGQQQQ